jgi:hypothetical protein
MGHDWTPYLYSIISQIVTFLVNYSEVEKGN